MGKSNKKELNKCKRSKIWLKRVIEELILVYCGRENIIFCGGPGKVFRLIYRYLKFQY
jgi:hypothetical protein